MSRLQIERADWSDREELRAMQAASFRVLGAPFYDSEVIEAFIANIGTMDDNLLSDGTYFKVVANDCIVASGGWSSRTPAYASRADQAISTSNLTKATVRSIFVHPDHAGHGIGRTMMGVIEEQIAAVGFGTASLLATLSGIPFYRRLGYRSGQPVELRMPGAPTFVGVEMEKPVAITGAERHKAA